AQTAIVDFEEAAFAPRFKVTRVVEYVVFRQQGLVGKAEQSLVTNNCGRIVKRAPGWLIAGTHGAYDRGQTVGRVNDFVQRIKRGMHHIRIEKPVQRRVTLDCDFRKDDEIRTVFLRLLNGAEDARNIAFDIAVRGVDLSDSDAHLG